MRQIFIRKNITIFVKRNYFYLSWQETLQENIMVYGCTYESIKNKIILEVLNMKTDISWFTAAGWVHTKCEGIQKFAKKLGNLSWFLPSKLCFSLSFLGNGYFIQNSNSIPHLLNLSLRPSLYIHAYIQIQLYKAHIHICM